MISETQYIAFSDYRFNVVPLTSTHPKWNGNNKETAFIGFPWKKWQKTLHPRNRFEGNCIVTCGQTDPKSLALCIIDLDVNHGDNFSIDSFLSEIQEKLNYPLTRIVRSPSGGFHLYYLLEEEMKKESIQDKKFNKQIFHGLRGIDIQCRGSIAACPPTEWTEGEKIGKYEWYNDNDLAILSKKDITNLINLVKIRKLDEPTSWEIATNIIISEVKDLRIEKGSRNNFVFALAGFLKFYDFPLPIAKEICEQCPTYVEISTINSLNYVDDVYNRQPNEIAFKEEMNTHLPGLTDKVAAMLFFNKGEYNNYVRFKLNSKGSRNKYLVHDVEGIYEFTESYDDETGKNVISDKTVISTYSVDSIALRKDPLFKQTRHIITLKRGRVTKTFANWFHPKLLNNVRDEIPSTHDGKYKNYLGIVVDELINSERVERTVKETNYGFTIENKEIVFLNNEDNDTYTLNGEYDKEKTKKVLEFIDYATTNITDPVHHSAAMKFIMAAPLSWCKILLGYKKKHIILRGDVDSGKTFFTEFSQIIYDAPSNFAGSVSSANKEARLVGLFDESTFIKAIEEGSELWSSKNKIGFNPYEIIKSSDKALVIRTHRTQDQKPVSKYNRATLMFTQNPHMSIPRSLMKRIDIMVFDSDEYQPDKTKHTEFEEKLTDIKPIAKHLGNYLMKMIPEKLTIEDLKDDLFVIGEKILKIAYADMGLEIPEWVNLKPKLHEDYNARSAFAKEEEAIRKFVTIEFQKAMKSHYRPHDAEDQLYGYTEIVNILANKKQLPSIVDMGVRRGGGNHLYFDKDFVELVNEKMGLEISSLKMLSLKIPKAIYSTRGGKRVVVIEETDFCYWLDNIENEYQGNLEDLQWK